MFAVIEAAGRQYRVAVGDRIQLDRVNDEKGLGVGEGAELTFERVLLVSDADGNDVKIGRPLIAGALVQGKVVEEGKGKKGLSFKFKRRKGYARKIGYRREFTTVEISQIKAA